MRMRTLKPEFWTDATIGRLTRDAQRTYMWLWNAADDKGRLKDLNGHVLKAGAFVYADDVTAKACDRLLQELIDAGRLLPYTVDGTVYHWLPKFMKHQQINKPTTSRLPPHPDESKEALSGPSQAALGLELAKDTRNTPGTLPEESGAVLGAGIRDQGEVHSPSSVGPAAAGPETKPRKQVPDCPYEAIRDLYNDLFVPLKRPACKVLSEPLKKSMRERWQRDLQGTADERLTAMRSYLERAAASPLLTGRKPGFDWEGVTLVWLMGPKNWAKVEAGNYDPSPGQRVLAPETFISRTAVPKEPVIPATSIDMSRIKNILSTRVPEEAFERWIKPLEYIGDRAQPETRPGRRVVVIEAPDDYHAKQVTDNFMERLKDAIWDAQRQIFSIELQGKETNNDGN